MDLTLLKDIAVIFLISVAVLFVFHRIRAPPVLGFLLTGVLAGPQGLDLVAAVDRVEVLAEIGVILLLFTIGMEVSLRDLLKIKTYVLVGGSLQVILTISAAFLLLRQVGVPSGLALLVGILISLSSTAIVLRIMQSRAEFDSLYGRTTLGILIFQDLAVVPMMLVIPMLSGEASATSPLDMLIRGLAIVAVVVVCAKWLVPEALYHIARTGDRELFLLSIISICIGVAYLTSMAGLSLGLGAFLAGLIISESPYSYQAFGNVLPLKDAFTSFFFVSIGMLMDVEFLVRNPGYIILLALGVMALKAVMAGSAIAILGLPVRIVILVGLALSQIGEFSFVLSKVGLDSGLLPTAQYQAFLDVTVLTMGATSFLMALAPRVADGMMRLPLPQRLKAGTSEFSSEKKLEDHLIIVGYGVNGRNVARSAKASKIPYIIVDCDPEIVRAEGQAGENIIYGDAAQDSVLEHAGIGRARVVVIAISDPASTRRIAEGARRLGSGAYIIARTRYLQEMKPLHDAGADEVIPEEYETSVEIFARVLERYDVPRDEIERYVDEIRSDGYEMFRTLSRQPYCTANIHLASEDVITLMVEEGAPISGRTVGDLELERQGMAVLAIHRGSGSLARPGNDAVLQKDDVVVMLGTPEKLARIEKMFTRESG
ncbi:MAG TPA: cation:proton antiporter [Methanotrichaceae archaeon]|nr:cation:proton antiporter [Methanotrichaceae archaeon]